MKSFELQDSNIRVFFDNTLIIHTYIRIIIDGHKHISLAHTAHG